MLLWHPCAWRYDGAMGEGTVSKKRLRLKTATCQFPVCESISENAKHISRYIVGASKASADVVHFPEYALSGYPGVDYPLTEPVDWALLRDKTNDICEIARQCRIWVVLGTIQRGKGRSKPTNTTAVISPTGEAVGHYHKSMLYAHEHDTFRAGSELLHIDIKGWRCGFLICYDSCFPDLYQELSLIHI